MNKGMKDERIIAQRRKIQSDAYQILVYCLLIAILIQLFILNAPFPQFAVEFFCLIGTGIYIIIRHLFSGIDLWNSHGQTKKKLIMNSVISGAMCTALTAFLAGERDVWNLALFFIVFTVVYFFTQFILQSITKQKQRQIDDALNDEDEANE